MAAVRIDAYSLHTHMIIKYIQRWTECLQISILLEVSFHSHPLKSFQWD